MEDLEDHRGAIEDVDAGRALEVALLGRRRDRDRRARPGRVGGRARRPSARRCVIGVGSSALVVIVARVVVLAASRASRTRARRRCRRSTSASSLSLPSPSTTPGRELRRGAGSRRPTGSRPSVLASRSSSAIDEASSRVGDVGELDGDDDRAWVARRRGVSSMRSAPWRQPWSAQAAEAARRTPSRRRTAYDACRHGRRRDGERRRPCAERGGSDDAFARRSPADRRRRAATVAAGPTRRQAPAGAASGSATPEREPSAVARWRRDASPPPWGRRSLPEVPATHYRTDREIARGGMGRIVAAEDLRLGRAVALKELIDPAADQLGRFQREALITARLQHPGIVPVYEAGRWPSGRAVLRDEAGVGPAARSR